MADGAPPLRAVVIGAGQIGCAMDQPGQRQPMTHAGGYQAVAGYELAGIADHAAEARERAAAWGCPVFSDVDELLEAVSPQVVSVCTDATTMPATLQQVLSRPLKAVIAEKPVASSAQEAQGLADLAAERSIPLLVNFTRRFMPAYRQVREAIAEEPPLSITIRYAKGITHNGSHALDLVRFLVGEITSVVPLASRADHTPDDPSISAFLSARLCPQVFLVGLDQRQFTQFEVDVTAPSWRMVIDDDGRRLRRSVRRDQSGVPPGPRLVEQPAEPAGKNLAMTTLLGHVLDVVHQNAAPLCTAQDAAQALTLAASLLPKPTGEQG